MTRASTTKAILAHLERPTKRVYKRARCTKTKDTKPKRLPLER